MTTFASVLLLLAASSSMADQFQHEGTISENNNVIMRWNVTATDVLVQVEAPFSGYLAIGWSKNGRMADSFAAAGWSTDGTAATTVTLELVLTSNEQSGVSLASDQPLRNSSVVTDNGVTKMTFRRPIQHATRPISVNDDIHMIWAAHSSAKTLAQHTAYGSFVVNMSKGTIATSAPAIIITHSVLMFLAYTFIFPLGVMWAKFRDKGNPDRIVRHKMLQFAAGIISIVGFVLAIVYRGSGPHFRNLHSITGLVLFIITWLQFFVAFARPEFGSSWRNTWGRFHINVGWLIYVVGPLVSVLGTLIYWQTIGNEMQIMLGAIILVTAIMWVTNGVKSCRKRDS